MIEKYYQLSYTDPINKDKIGDKNYIIPKINIRKSRYTSAAELVTILCSKHYSYDLEETIGPVLKKISNGSNKLETLQIILKYINKQLFNLLDNSFKEKINIFHIKGLLTKIDYKNLNDNLGIIFNKNSEIIKYQKENIINKANKILK